MSRFALVLCLGIVHLPAALAADASKPHPHHGVVARPPSPPTPIALTAAEEAQLAARQPVRKQQRDTGTTGGRGVAVMDIEAPVEDVWATIEAFGSYPAWIDQVETCAVYRRAGEHVYVDFMLTSMGMDIEYYIDHTVRKDLGYITWTLDYGRESDLDDSVGYWLVRPHPTKPGWTRVDYSVALQVASYVPDFAANMVADRGLKDATTWLPKNAEARARARTSN